VIERRGSVVCTEVDPQVLELCVSRLPEAKCVLTSPSDERLPAADGDLALPLVYEVAPVTNAAWFPLEARRALGRGALEVRLMDDTALTAQAATVAGGCGAGQVALHVEGHEQCQPQVTGSHLADGTAGRLISAQRNENAGAPVPGGATTWFLLLPTGPELVVQLTLNALYVRECWIVLPLDRPSTRRRSASRHSPTGRQQCSRCGGR
jgi:hypothetical protein